MGPGSQEGAVLVRREQTAPITIGRRKEELWVHQQRGTQVSGVVVTKSRGPGCRGPEVQEQREEDERRVEGGKPLLFPSCLRTERRLA